MATSHFNLQEVLQNKSPKEQIEALRALARKYRNANNELVKQIWDINMELTNLTAGKKKDDLLHRQKDLEQKLATDDYITQLDELLKLIHDMEIDLYGASDVGGSSPYEL